MIGPILILASWLLLRIEGKGLAELGFNAPRARARQFAGGFCLTAVAASAQQLGLAYAAGNEWVLNPAFSGALLLESVRWNVNSVLYEELLFRGYLLYQAIRLLGPRRAALLDAAAFGVYHWFSFGALGNPVAMAFVFVMTGAFGLMFAISFRETKSVALPLGLHFGWNMVTNLVFSAGPLGATLLVAANGTHRFQVHAVAGMLLRIALPMLVVAGVCWYLTRRRTVAPQPLAVSDL
jgi:membrane protease YdiL (CAAX protease family)